MIPYSSILFDPAAACIPARDLHHSHAVNALAIASASSLFWHRGLLYCQPDTTTVCVPLPHRCHVSWLTRCHASHLPRPSVSCPEGPCQPPSFHAPHPKPSPCLAIRTAHECKNRGCASSGQAQAQLLRTEVWLRVPASHWTLQTALVSTDALLRHQLPPLAHARCAWQGELSTSLRLARSIEELTTIIRRLTVSTTLSADQTTPGVEGQQQQK